MSSEECRRPGWGVRPIGWKAEEESDIENEDEVNFESKGMNEKDFAKWVSTKWNLVEFDENKPVTERKQEWGRFIEQFSRIVEVRNLSSIQKCQALKIQAGQYLNDIMKTKKNTLHMDYDAILSYLNSYFNQTCDSRQERCKFRDLKMRSDESFVDFELKCEKQIKYCNFPDEQAEEELAEALIRRSVPEISKHLRLLAPTLQNDLFAIIKQGTHLDNMRKEDEENKETNENFERPVMNLHKERFRGSRNSYLYQRKEQRYNPYQRKFGNERQSGLRGAQRTNFNQKERCEKCGEIHAYNSCPAYNRKCMKCHRWGHYARCCKSSYQKDGNVVTIKEDVRNINQVKFESEKCENINSEEED